MSAGVGADMRASLARHGPALARIVLGKGPFAERRQFYKAVTGCGLADGQTEPDPSPAQGLEAAETEALAELIMAEFGRSPAAEVRRRLGSLRVLAASRVRARATGERGLRQGTGEVHLTGARLGHAGFFALEVADLSYRRFDGRMSPSLTREVFLLGDAVTVLPYDPSRDRVLVIEQMRMGPLGRGDPLPWQIEAIAGRIDPGETPEAAARREAEEEAGLKLGRLEKIGAYYPSPGAVSEYIYSYLAICALPDDAAGLFGAEAEAEDIRGMILSHEGLMAALARGDLTSAPLFLSALWLDRERPRLRQGSG